MIPRPKPKSSWLPLLLVVVAVVVWAVDQKKSLDHPAKPAPTQTQKSAAPKSAEKTGRYEIYRNCTLVEARNNDGDSFRVHLSNGKEAEFRLYFVDTPESAFKSYAGGETNHERIRQQAADLGGITPQQAVDIGQKGKHFTLGLLASKPFTLYTEWDSPFHDNRYHAHIEVQQDGKTRWLHQILVERGLVRLITKPADLPDGTPAAKEKENLRNLEREAKRNRVGVWGL
ncbi:MAG: thermonuclease family protein [Luteolibacter sp.]